MLYYFDSSILLAILLDENRKNDAIDLWNEASVRVSSILLKLETITVLRRTYEHNKNKLEANWIAKKLNELNEYLQEIKEKVFSKYDMFIVLSYKYITFFLYDSFSDRLDFFILHI